MKCSSSCLAREICSCATMFRPPDSPAPQLPPEIRNKLVRIDVYAKNSNNNEEILPATWQQEQRRLGRRRRCGGGALRLRPPAALQRLRLRWRQKNIGNNQLYRKLECVAVLCEDGDVLWIRRGWGCAADQARMGMCCCSGEGREDGGVQWIRRA